MVKGGVQGGNSVWGKKGLKGEGHRGWKMSDGSCFFSVLCLCTVVPLMRNSTFWAGWNRVNRAGAQPYKAVDRSQLREALLTGTPLIFFHGFNVLSNNRYNVCMSVSGSRCCSQSGISSDFIAILAFLIFLRISTECARFLKTGFGGLEFEYGFFEKRLSFRWILFFGLLSIV